MESDPDVGVLAAAGPSMLDAARWVGAACWTELRLHEVLGAWAFAGVEPGRASALWTVRSGRAEAAEAWHRRLPELREFPREGFVSPPSPELEGVLDEFAALAPAGRVSALVSVLGALHEAYAARVAIACGPADGPVARTLQDQLRRLDADRALLGAPPDSGWAGRLTIPGDPMFGSGVL